MGPEESFCTACGTLVAHEPAATSGDPPAPAVLVKRPPGIGIIGGSMVVLGSIVLLLFLGGMFLAYTNAEGWTDIVTQSADQLDVTPEEAIPLLWGAMIAGSLLALVAVIAGAGALRAKRWAWTIMIVLMALNAMGAIFELPSAMGILGILVSAIVIWYFLRPEVKAWFRRP